MNLLLVHVTKRKDLYLTLLKTGSQHLTPDIINPSMFLIKLQNAQKFLQNGVRFPINLSFKHIMKFYKISKVYSQSKGCDIEVKIIIPTVSNLLHKAFKCTSVPMVKNTKLFIVPIEKDVILKSYNNSLISTMKYSDYKSCIDLQDFNLCSKSISSSNECIVQMFTNRSTNSCDFQPLNLKHQMWIQMADRNTWIYAIPDTIKINILYNNTWTTMELSGVGKLKIIKSCLVKSGDIHLHYFSSDFSDFEIDSKKIDFPQIPQTKYFDKKIPDTIQHSVISNYNDKELFNEIIN